MSKPVLQVWQQRLECEESERQQLQTRFDQTVASMQQSAAATTLLLQKHAATMSTSALDLEASGTLKLLGDQHRLPAEAEDTSLIQRMSGNHTSPCN